MNIDIKSWKTGDILFSHDCKANTVKKTVEAALKNKVSLDYADLDYADLDCADLDCADLSYAQLNYAQLNYAELGFAQLNYAQLNYAELIGTQLIGTQLKGAQLKGAQLNDANFIYCTGNGKEIKSENVHKAWLMAYTSKEMAIGCEQHSIEEWRNFTDYEINSMNKNALEFWEKNKKNIFKILHLSRAEG